MRDGDHAPWLRRRLQYLDYEWRWVLPQNHHLAVPAMAKRDARRLDNLV